MEQDHISLLPTKSFSKNASEKFSGKKQSVVCVVHYYRKFKGFIKSILHTIGIL